MENQYKTIRVGIIGYGNLGRGVEMAIGQNPDMELTAIFTRRDPGSLHTGAKAVSISALETYRHKIDVMILCGGSATDLPEQVPQVAQWFNTVDSFDTHAKIPEYFNQIDAIAKSHKTLSLISTGWDPGLFSIARLLGQSILPNGADYTFWGKGVSQGHSDAIRRVPGVKNGVQYTIPIENALAKVRAGGNPVLTTAEKHERVCYVVAEAGADTNTIATAIKTMPNYFDQYNTTVHFISEEELKAHHSTMPHGGIVFRTGTTGNGTKHRMEFSLTLEDNPGFTSNVLVAYARAIARLASEGQTGARTVFDIAPGYLSPKPAEELRKTIL